MQRNLYISNIFINFARKIVQINNNNMKNRWILIGAAVLGLAACGGNPEAQFVPTSYPTMEVSKSDITLPLKYSATLKGTSDVTIKPQVSGQLMEVCIVEGQQVKKGDVLFKIDSRDAALELESAEANLLAAQASESSAKLEYESTQNLYEKKIVSKYMLDNAENEYKQAQASTAQAKASADRARVNLGYCTITAPVDGVIGSIDVFAGDQVNQGTYLTMVSGNAKMYAEFSVSESILEERSQAEVKDNESLLALLPDVTFLFKNGAEYPLKGRITSITGTVDRTTGTLTCKATFPNPDGGLYSGVQGTVVVPIEEKDVIVIPQQAVVRLQNKSLVYKVGEDNCAYSTIVTTVGISSERDLVVTSGLEVGDVIVTEGANNVYEGQMVIF